MNIRAHHLLCIRNFKGKGYNKEFIHNFYFVLKKLPREKIKIVNSVDAICEKCPHNDDGVCKKRNDSERKTRRMDNRLIKIAKISLEKEYLYSKLKDLVKNIKAKDFCKDCEWKDFCENFTTKKRLK